MSTSKIRWRAAEKALLRKLDLLLRPAGFARFGQVFNRVAEPGVVHVVELTRAKGVFGLAVGVSFDEVIEFAAASGPDWGLFVGTDKQSRHRTVRSCQFLGDIGRFRESGLAFGLTASELMSDDVVEQVTSLVKDRGLPALVLLGTREAVLRNWTDQFLSAAVGDELDRAESEGRPPAVFPVEADRRRRQSPSFAGLLFWGTPAVSFAIIGERAGRRTKAAEVLRAEMAAVEAAKPNIAARLSGVAKRLNLSRS